MLTHPRTWLPDTLIDVYDHWLWEWQSIKGRTFQKKLYKYPNLEYLHLGCGNIPDRRYAEFLNVDFFRWKKEVDLALDLRFPIPLESNRWKGIYTHHFLEHISYNHAIAFFQECHRLLKENGVLRIVVPDAGKVIRKYCDDSSDCQEDLLTLLHHGGPFYTPMEVINYLFRDTKFNAHLFAWDYETLAYRLKEAGFSQIRQSEAGTSYDPILAKDVMSWSRFSLYVDAVK